MDELRREALQPIAGAFGQGQQFCTSVPIQRFEDGAKVGRIGSNIIAIRVLGAGPDQGGSAAPAQTSRFRPNGLIVGTRGLFITEMSNARARCSTARSLGAGAHPRSGGFQVGLGEVAALKQQRLPGNESQRVGEAVPEI